VPVLNSSPGLYAQLPPTADALLALQQSPGVFNGLDLLINTNELLAPAIRFIAPAQTTCNYLSLAFRNVAASAEDNGVGGWFNAITFEPAEGTNNEGGQASAPANGGEPPGANKGSPLNHLHSNPYPNTAAPGQPKECEAGNERFESDLGVTRIGNTPRNDGIKTAEQSKKQLGEEK
jgi:hypothetical protein